MSAVKKHLESLIHEEIRSHKAWFGNISGLTAEKFLRNRKTPYLFMLREGEQSNDTQADYYVTFILPDLTIKHQPFVITTTVAGWEWENTGGGGAPPEASIEEVLYLIMHCEKSQPIPVHRLEFSGK